MTVKLSKNTKLPALTTLFIVPKNLLDVPGLVLKLISKITSEDATISNMSV